MASNNRQRPDVPVTHGNEVEHRRILAQRANASLARDGTNEMTQPLTLASINVADLPDASLWEGAICWVPDDSGGATLAVSDGTDWRRAGDNAIVS